MAILFLMTDDRQADEQGPRVLDTAALRAVAHPLRIKILDLLAAHGPQTASTLATLTGESSGSTSYHLRMLARHELVREIEGRGGRERWWERPRGGISFGDESVRDSPAGRAVLQVAVGEYHRARSQTAFEYFTRLADGEPREWRNASLSMTSSARLTAAQMAELGERLRSVLSEYVEAHRDQEGDALRAVNVNIDLFPLQPLGGAS